MPEVEAGAGPQQVLDLLVGLGRRETRVDVDEDQVRRRQPELAARAGCR